MVGAKRREKDDQHYWLFVDSRTRIVSRRLSQSAADSFVSNLKNVNIDQWWAWNPSFRDWIPLKNIIHTKNGNLHILIQLPEGNFLDHEKTEATSVNENTHIPEEYSEVRNYLSEETVDEFRDFHGDELTVSRFPKPPALGLGSDRRGSERHEKRLEVLIAGKGKSFRTQTVNLSLTGVMLEKAIPPEMQGGPFEIVFYFQSQGNKKQLVFQGKVSGDLRDRRRLVFGDLTPNNQKILEELFVA